jgi:molybdopterin converting factor small subunit
MSMSRRDFVKIAAALKDAADAAQTETEKSNLGTLVLDLCSVFREANANFNKAKFLQAAGIDWL